MTLIIEELGHEAIIKERSDEDMLTTIDNNENLKSRPAIVLSWVMLITERHLSWIMLEKLKLQALRPEE